MKVTAVVPSYEPDEKLIQVVDGLLAEGFDDIVVVNDGSRDKTAAVCRAHGYRLIDLPVNLGLAGAFQTGLRNAAENDYDCAMQLDADGQHLPLIWCGNHKRKRSIPSGTADHIWFLFIKIHHGIICPNADLTVMRQHTVTKTRKLRLCLLVITADWCT